MYVTKKVEKITKNKVIHRKLWIMWINCW